MESIVLAKWRRQVEQKVHKLFQQYQYQEVVLPILEDYESIKAGLTSKLKDKVLKLLDKNGRLLVLRPDITLSIAHHLANNTYSTPMKLYYIAEAFPEGTAVYQAGCEYIHPQSNTEVELIQICIKLLEQLDIGDFKIDIGNVAFYKAIVGDIENKELERAIAQKDSVKMKTLVDKLALGQKRKELLLLLPQLYGYPDVLDRVPAHLLENSAKEAIEKLQLVCSHLKDAKLDNYIMVDLGYVPPLDYYSGIVFEVLHRGKQIGSGGRYDDLLGKFAKPYRACGFAINLSEIAWEQR